MIAIKIIVLILIVVLGLILALLLGLVIVPVHLRGTLKKNKEQEAIVDIRWLWGVLGLELVFLTKRKFVSFKLFKAKLFTSKIKSVSPEEKKAKALKKAEKKAKKKTNKKEKKKKKRQPLKNQLEQIMATTQTISMEAPKELVTFLSHLFSSLKLKLVGVVEVGLSDPANTGMLLGLFNAIDGLLTKLDFKLNPNWEESTLKGNITFYSRVWLVDIIKVSARFILSSSIRKIWWPKVKARMKFRGRVKPRAVQR